MKKLFVGVWRVVQFVLSLAVLIVIGYGVFLILRDLLGKMGALNDNIIAAFVAALTAVFGYWYTQKQSKEKDIAESHRSKKIELCQSFMDILLSMMNASRENKPVDPKNIDKELLDKFNNINSGIILWGSPNIIKSWLLFKQESKPDSTATPLFRMDDVLRAFRKELGHSNRGLKEGDLIKIFLKDPSEIDKLIQQRKKKKGV